ncbi:hypothetical protein V2G26_007177 [Clonostachys chloroleuca]
MGAVAVTPMIRGIVETFDTKVLYTTCYVLFIVACTVTKLYRRVSNESQSRFRFANAQETVRIAGMVGMFWTVGIIVGPFISGGLANNSATTWRWVSSLVTNI